MCQLEDLGSKLQVFAARRKWEGFHTPKNLAMALASEAGELLAEFQWLTPDESNVDALSIEQSEAIRLEIADVFLYLVRLADSLHVDLYEAAFSKLLINERRFPES